MYHAQMMRQIHVVRMSYRSTCIVTVILPNVILRVLRAFLEQNIDDPDEFIS